MRPGGDIALTNLHATDREGKGRRRRKRRASATQDASDVHVPTPLGYSIEAGLALVDHLFCGELPRKKARSSKVEQQGERIAVSHGRKHPLFGPWSIEHLKSLGSRRRARAAVRRLAPGSVALFSLAQHDGQNKLLPWARGEFALGRLHKPDSDGKQAMSWARFARAMGLDPSCSANLRAAEHTFKMLRDIGDALSESPIKGSKGEGAKVFRVDRLVELTGRVERLSGVPGHRSGDWVIARVHPALWAMTHAEDTDEAIGVLTEAEGAKVRRGERLGRLSSKKGKRKRAIGTRFIKVPREAVELGAGALCAYMAAARFAKYQGRAKRRRGRKGRRFQGAKVVTLTLREWAEVTGKLDVARPGYSRELAQLERECAALLEVGLVELVPNVQASAKGSDKLSVRLTRPGARADDAPAKGDAEPPPTEESEEASPQVDPGSLPARGPPGSGQEPAP